MQKVHFFNIHQQKPQSYTGWAKNGLFFRVDNFAMVCGRNVCDMSKFSKFYIEKVYKTCMSVC